MKTAVILSDTHGNKKDLMKLENILSEADYIFHLGDGFYDLNCFGSYIMKKVVQVVGNCDPVAYDSERLIEIEGVKIFMTHGHFYGAKGSNLRLLLKAKEVGANVCLYGHSHAALIEEVDGITLANPGNITKYSTNKTFIYAVFDKGKAVLKINDTTLNGI